MGGEAAKDLCEGPQALQAASHSSSKAALSPQGGEQQAVLGGVGLVGPVRPAKLLNGFVCGPGQLKREVHPPLLVFGAPAESKGYSLSGSGCSVSNQGTLHALSIARMSFSAYMQGLAQQPKGGGAVCCTRGWAGE